MSLHNYISSMSVIQLQTVVSMVDYDLVDWEFSVDDLVSAVEMFGYTIQDIENQINSNSKFIYQDEYDEDEYYSDEAIVARMLDNDLHYGKVLPSFIDDSFTLSQQDVADHAALDLMHELWVHSVDSRVGF